MLWGAPTPVYKGGGEDAAGLGGVPQGGVQLGLPILVGLPFLFRRGEGGKGEEEEKERGAPLPSPIRTPYW